MCTSNLAKPTRTSYKSVAKTKPRKCPICGEKFTPARSSQKYCSASCKDKAAYAKRVAIITPIGKIRKDNRKKAKDWLIRLRQSDFMKHLLLQIARHGSIDCLLDFPINSLFRLYKTRNILAFETGSSVHMAHLIPCKDGGAYHPDNLSLLPQDVNQSHGARFKFPAHIGCTWTQKPPLGTAAPSVKVLDQYWDKLVERFEDKLRMFSKAHPTLKGTERLRNAARILGEVSDSKLFNTLPSLQRCEESTIEDLCDQFSVSYTNPVKTYDDQGNPQDVKLPSVIVLLFHINRLRSFYNAEESEAAEIFTKAVSLLPFHLPENPVVKSIIKMAVEAKPLQALAALRDSVTKSQTIFNKSTYQELLMCLSPQHPHYEDQFIICDSDCSNEQVEIISSVQEEPEEIPAELIAILEKCAESFQQRAQKNARIAIKLGKERGIHPVTILKAQSETIAPQLFQRSMKELYSHLRMEQPAHDIAA